MTFIHKKAKTPAEKFAKLPTQYQEQFLELMRAYQPTVEPTVEKSVKGIVVKAAKPTVEKPKAKPKAGVDVVVEDEINYVRITNADGRAFKFGVRKALEIVENIDGIVSALNAINAQ